MPSKKECVLVTVGPCLGAHKWADRALEALATTAYLQHSLGRRSRELSVLVIERKCLKGLRAKLVDVRVRQDLVALMEVAQVLGEQGDQDLRDLVRYSLLILCIVNWQIF